MSEDDNNDDEDEKENDEDIATITKLHFVNPEFNYSHSYHYSGFLSEYNYSIFNFSCTVNTDLELTEIDLHVYNYSYYMDLRTVYTQHDDFDFADNEEANAIMLSSLGILHKNDSVECYFKVRNEGGDSPVMFLNQQHVVFVELDYVWNSTSYHTLNKYSINQTNFGDFTIGSMAIFRLD